MKGYGLISKPLIDLLKKEGFHWSPTTQGAFDRLRNAMASAPILALPDFTKEFVVETNASSEGIRAVLQ